MPNNTTYSREHQLVTLQDRSYENLISVLNDKYSHYTKDKTINTRLKKLEYAIKTATKRVREMEEDKMSNKDDDVKVAIPDSSRG